MRRGVPKALKARPGVVAGGEPATWMAVELPLDVITSVVGGGVESFTPDSVDFVRVQGIRGQLRWFWRALQPPMGAEALFDRERRLWGGVGEESSSGDAGTWRSRVHVEVNVDNKGRDEPAGYHPRGDDGRFKSLPEWKGNPARGYGLFPLQRAREYLDRQRGRGLSSVATMPVRDGLKLTLQLRLLPPPRGEEADPKADAAGVLQALWTWVHFGGLGARTTRGFGALAPRGAGMRLLVASDPSVKGIAEKWQRRFQAPRTAGDVARWLREVMVELDAPTPDEGKWPVLRGAAVYAGRAVSSAEEAHAGLLRALQAFRQVPGVGRNPGRQRGRPGRSRWPEANMLRKVAQRHSEIHFGDHEPPHDPPMAAPRAAFGLPIVVAFKDALDKQANGTIVAKKRAEGDGDRWASPLRLRPLRCDDGSFVPIALALSRRPGIEGVTEVTVKLNNRPQEEAKGVNVRTSARLDGPMGEVLHQAKGDAITAFLRWLTQQGFQAVRGGQP